MTAPVQIPAEIDKLVDDLYAGWELGAPPEDLTITVSTRMKTALGRCRPERPEIRLAAFLLDGPPALLQEVLCHEVAHLAVHSRYGGTARPHGPEWRSFMVRAGFEPRLHIPTDRPRPPRARKEPAVWAHRCPVCRMTRMAHRRVPQWRCASCLEHGLGGELVIERVEGRRKGSTSV